MLLRIMALALALLTLPLAGAMAVPVRDEAPFNESPILMMNGACKQKVTCSNLSRQSRQIISSANECMRERFRAKKNMLSEFRSSGDFENCAVPGGGDYVLNQQKLASWGVCCVKQQGDACQLICGLYMSPKAVQ
ncbi:MAG: hypothetical protein IPI58_04075 [Alphaproteobacteria bacterium]|nr:MAG: hypothetical protein IPI58_04075 [Alphaproteobacteria bacterium]